VSFFCEQKEAKKLYPFRVAVRISPKHRERLPVGASLVEVGAVITR
jgi:hypothetical protein